MDWLNSVTGLVAAVTTLIAATTALIATRQRSKKENLRGQTAEASQGLQPLEDETPAA